MLADNQQPEAGCSDGDHKLMSLESTVGSTPQRQVLPHLFSQCTEPQDTSDPKCWDRCLGSAAQECADVHRPAAALHQELLFTRTLVQAVCFERPEVVSSILEEVQRPQMIRLEHGRTVLMYGVLRENLSILESLLFYWPQILDCQDDSGLTALSYCIQFSKLKSANWLMNKGCTLDIRNDVGQTALHLAAQLDQIELFLTLKAKSADMLALDKYGKFASDYLKDQKLKCAINKEFSSEMSEIQNNCLRRKFHFRMGLMRSPSPAVRSDTQKSRPHYSDQFTEQAFKSLINERCDVRGGASLLPAVCRKRIQKLQLSRQKDFQIKLRPCLLEAKDFVVEDVLGGGENNPHAISHTYCARYKWGSLENQTSANGYLAIKEYPKRLMLSSDRLKYLQLEKKALMNFQHPFIVKLVSCFQSEEKVYIATEFCKKGDLGRVLQKQRLSIAETQILAAELVLALEALHEQGFSHRDLKPENVLIAADGHVRLADFGMCHQKQSPNRKPNKCAFSRKQNKARCPTTDLTSTFCGTLVYIPPEVLTHKKYRGSAADWYLLGEILFEAVVGYPPFIDQSKDAIKANILEGTVIFPKGVGNAPFRDLVTKLLAKNPEHRLGFSQGGQEIKTHPFFLGVDFEEVLHKQTPLFDPDTLADVPISYLGISLNKATKRLSTLHNQQVLKELDWNQHSTEGFSTYSDSDSESEDQDCEYLELRGWSFVN